MSVMLYILIYRDLSYFVSHTPLFWEYDQRRDFSYAFYQLCKKFPKTIPKLQFHQQHKTNINPDWSNELSSLPQPYTDVYDHGMINHLFCYTTKISLMFFHRNCHIHLKDYVSLLDISFLHLYIYIWSR